MVKKSNYNKYLNLLVLVKKYTISNRTTLSIVINYPILTDLLPTNISIGKKE